ncbi:MAG TPA: hypothetical protein VJ672_15550 [Gemmatimonadaceae bacterium]|nr:hypothetical protein [Gemmatimonadaceae bacterium]
MFYQVMALLGAVLVLGAYAALQRGWLRAEQRLFSALNFVGAGLLTWVAAIDGRIGFILLEGTWALMSLPGLLRRRTSA